MISRHKSLESGKDAVASFCSSFSAKSPQPANLQFAYGGDLRVHTRGLQAVYGIVSHPHWVIGLQGHSIAKIFGYIVIGDFEERVGEGIVCGKEWRVGKEFLPWG
jgi:hypothetical protein